MGKTKNHPVGDNEEDLKTQPHSFVFSKGPVGRYVRQLVRDVRTIMEPNTASRLKARRQNVLKDFVQVAGVLHVSHLVVFTKTEDHLNMRIIRLPHGPTLTFRVEGFTLARDVISSLKRYHTEQSNLLHAPLIILNNFASAAPPKDGDTAHARPTMDNHMKLVSSIFQSMFPSINVNTLKLASMKRCFLVNFSDESQTFDLRQYAVRAVPVGVSRPLKKLLVSSNKVPDLGSYKDASDFLLKCGQLSESEAELDGPANEVTLPQDISGRGNMKHNTSAIRLYEMGPRLALRLVKIEAGISNGEVLYHSYVKKTPEEVEALRKAVHRKQSVKAARRHQQELNVKRKQAEEQEKSDKKAAAKKRRLERAAGRISKRNGEPSDSEASEKEDEREDEREYFRQEVGVEPEPELFGKREERKKPAKKPNSKEKDAAPVPRVSAGGVSKKKPVGKFFRKAASKSSSAK